MVFHSGLSTAPVSAGFRRQARHGIQIDEPTGMAAFDNLITKLPPAREAAFHSSKFKRR
jgi:hypothetical protein